MHALVILVWLSLCTVQDIAQRRISNWLTFGGLACAALYLALTGKSVIGASPTSALFAFVLAVLLTVPGYALKRLGAADVKLLAALGLASAPNYVLYSLALACIGQVAVHLLGQQLHKVIALKVPFAPFIFVGFGVSAFVLMN